MHIALDKDDPSVPLKLYEDFLRDRYGITKYPMTLTHKFRMQSLAEAVRTAQLQPLQLAIIQSIMVIDQQCYTITRELLAARVNSSHSFEWAKHLRFYWDDKKHTCYLKQASNVLPYGYEFLGLIPRGHVALGSERYMLALTDSLRSALGCVVQGAGEKVETLRELSRSLGRMFASFCGSPTAPTHSILRFLCAVSQIGAWGCFFV